jgi:hypothetical protein
MPKKELNKSDQAIATRSTIARPWLVRVVIIFLVLLGYGIWSVYDAYIAYPERGERYASYAEYRYLEKAIEADRTESPGVLRREAKVPDPEDELRRLKSNEVSRQNLEDAQGGPRQKRAEMELAREEWLTALDRVNMLSPEHTDYEERPRERFQRLETRWTTEAPPGKLASYDIPVNKIAALICFAFCIYLLYLFVRVAVRTYKWDPTEQKLTLPGGESITPDDLADVDKRKWDKFIVFLKVKDSHPSLGGKEVRFDTYRHGLVEDWILQMERTAFPERAKDQEAAQAESRDEDADAQTVDASAENERS